MLMNGFNMPTALRYLKNKQKYLEIHGERQRPFNDGFVGSPIDLAPYIRFCTERQHPRRPRPHAVAMGRGRECRGCGAGAQL